MKKSALILLVAVAISTVSCVDNAVSPQVEAIRSQQVEWMKAKTAGEVAANEMQTILNTYESASNAIALKTEDATYAVLVAQNEKLAMEAKLALAEAKTQLDAELAKATLAVAAQGNAKAEAYLLGFTTEAGQLAEAIGIRLELQNKLVEDQLLVAGHPEDLASYLLDTQSNIDAEEAKIVGYKAAIALYNNIDGRNSDSYKAEFDALLIKRRALEVTEIKLLHEIVRNNIELALLVDPFDTKTEARFNQNEDRKTKKARLVVLDGSTDADDIEESATLEADILVLNASIAKLDAELVVIVASKKKLDDSNTSKEDLIDANSETMLKDVAVINALQEIIFDLEMAMLTPAGSLNITALISGLEGDIETSTGLISDYKTDLKSTSKETLFNSAKARIITYTKMIAKADIEITAQEKIVAYWKALLDKIFTA